MANRLAGSPSPYLEQHQDNPVDWWPWSEEAFAEARRRDVPVFLSIGYATCHWCHVMAHESFEDEGVARLLNEHFVAIKVDREERPDIDETYMAVCQAQNGSGGWPLTVILDHERRPWFTGTYFPRATRSHRIGMLDLVPRLAAVWEERREELEENGRSILAQLTPKAADPADVPNDGLARAAEALTQRFDPEHAGFSGAPKFPSPHQIVLMLRQHRRTGDAEPLRMAVATLDAMAAGGVHDHVGGGFHRYSTDRHWLLPHFEKMLYDQATLLGAYTEAWQATGDDRHRQVAEDIVAYVLRDLQHADGAWFCAEDADSEGVEGKFYVWRHDEVRAVLGAEADAFCDAFNIRPDGNFHDEATGEPVADNIPHVAVGDDVGPWAAHLVRLRTARAQRIRPLRDEKILSDWNGLWITSLARAAMAMDRPDWLAAAKRGGEFFVQHMLDGRLRHRFRDGHVDDDAFLDDHAFLGLAFATLFEATGDSTWLTHSQALANALLARFAADGAFTTAPRDSEFGASSRRDAYDGAIPSGNSGAVELLWRLGRITAEAHYEEAAESCLRAFGPDIQRHPAAFTAMVCGFDAMHNGREILVTNDALWPAAWSWCPEAVRILATAATGPPWTREYPPGAAYVCQDHACQAPVTDAKALQALLKPRGA